MPVLSPLSTLVVGHVRAATLRPHMSTRAPVRVCGFCIYSTQTRGPHRVCAAAGPGDAARRECPGPSRDPTRHPWGGPATRPPTSRPDRDPTSATAGCAQRSGVCRVPFPFRISDFYIRLFAFTRRLYTGTRTTLRSPAHGTRDTGRLNVARTCGRTHGPYCPYSTRALGVGTRVAAA